MRRSRALTGAITVGAFTIAAIFAASPASAATLPEGQQITVIDYLEGEAQFLDANPADAVLTPLAAPEPFDFENIGAVDVNDEGLGYAIANFDGDPGVSSLYAADANTGTLSSPLLVMLDFGDVQVEAESCSALDYTAGVLMAICFGEYENNYIAYWGTVDPTAAPGEAWLSPLYQFDNEEFYFFGAMAVDPTTGIVYATASPDGSGLFALSEDEGATLVTEMDKPAFGFDFDRNGQAWVTTYEDVFNGEFLISRPALATVDLVDGSNPFIEPFTVDGELLSEPWILPITVWGAAAPDVAPAALAATGAEASVLPIVGAAGLLLAGAILAAVTVLRRRQSEV